MGKVRFPWRTGIALTFLILGLVVGDPAGAAESETLMRLPARGGGPGDEPVDPRWGDYARAMRDAVTHGRPNDERYFKSPVYRSAAERRVRGNKRGLILSPAGTFPVHELPFASSLMAKAEELEEGAEILRAGKGRSYLFATLSDAALAGGGIEARVGALGSSVDLVQHLHNGIVLLRALPSELPVLRDSALFDQVDFYHPGFKLAATIGRRFYLSEERAGRTDYDLDVSLFPGEEPGGVTRAIEALGGSVRHAVTIGDRTSLKVALPSARIPSLARFGAVMAIYETPEFLGMNTQNPSEGQTGRYNDYAVPYFDIGVDGGGVQDCIGFGPNGSNDSTLGGDDAISGDGRHILAGPNLVCESTRGGDDVETHATADLVAPQYVYVADDGASLDSAGLAHDLSAPCTAGDCASETRCVAGAAANVGQICGSDADCGGTTEACQVASLADVGPTHRKVESYTTGRLTDGTGAGDTLHCDSAASSLRSHGNVVANMLVGNPSHGIHGLAGMTPTRTSAASSTRWISRSTASPAARGFGSRTSGAPRSGPSTRAPLRWGTAGRAHACVT